MIKSVIIVVLVDDEQYMNFIKQEFAHIFALDVFAPYLSSDFFFKVVFSEDCSVRHSVSFTEYHDCSYVQPLINHLIQDFLDKALLTMGNKYINGLYATPLSS
jgi:hypothetical protein